jgi:hypothetical protein
MSIDQLLKKKADFVGITILLAIHPIQGKGTGTSSDIQTQSGMQESSGWLQTRRADENTRLLSFQVEPLS